MAATLTLQPQTAKTPLALAARGDIAGRYQVAGDGQKATARRRRPEDDGQKTTA